MPQYQVKLQKFQGPLDLLLQLIEAEELPINEVALASVTEQYVQHLRSIEEKNPEELADFLLVASKLLLIKSRVLLPEINFGAEEDGLSLEEQLRLYREYAMASRVVHKLIGRHRFVFSRERAPFQDGVFAPPEHLTMEKLRNSFLDVLAAIEPVLEIPKAALSRTISIKDKIEEIRKMVMARAQVGFGSILRTARNKTEMIISFLALLELIKQRVIYVNQDDLFEEITITKI